MTEKSFCFLLTLLLNISFEQEIYIWLLLGVSPNLQPERSSPRRRVGWWMQLIQGPPRPTNRNLLKAGAPFVGWRLVLKRKGERMLSGPGSQRRGPWFRVGLHGGNGNGAPCSSSTPAPLLVKCRTVSGMARRQRGLRLSPSSCGRGMVGTGSSVAGCYPGKVAVTLGKPRMCLGVYLRALCRRLCYDVRIVPWNKGSSLNMILMWD